jgi:hypothetical protein
MLTGGQLGGGGGVQAEAAGEAAGDTVEEVEQLEQEEYEEEVLSAEAAAVDMTAFKPQKPVDWNDADDGVWEPPEEYGAYVPPLARVPACSASLETVGERVWDVLVVPRFVGFLRRMKDHT